MDKTNKDYNALKELVLHIHEATTLQEAIVQKENEINTLNNVDIDFNHQEFPYFKEKMKLEEDILKTTPLKIIVAVLINTLISGLFAMIPLLIVYNLSNNQIISDDNVRLMIVISILVGMIIFIGLLLLIPKRTWTLQTLLKRKLLSKKRIPMLEQAKEASIKLVDEYYIKIKDKIKMLEKGIKLDQKELSKHQVKIDKNTILHAKYYKDIDLIFDYFETNRAEAIKEAINLLEKERKEAFYFERLLYAFKHKEFTVEELKDTSFNPQETLQKIKAEKEEALKLENLELDADVDSTEEQETIEDPLIKEVIEAEKTVSNDLEITSETNDKKPMPNVTLQSNNQNDIEPSQPKKVKSKQDSETSNLKE